MFSGVFGNRNLDDNVPNLLLFKKFLIRPQACGAVDVLQNKSHVDKELHNATMMDICGQFRMVVSHIGLFWCYIHRNLGNLTGFKLLLQMFSQSISLLRML